MVTLASHADGMRLPHPALRTPASCSLLPSPAARPPGIAHGVSCEARYGVGTGPHLQVWGQVWEQVRTYRLLLFSDDCLVGASFPPPFPYVSQSLCAIGFPIAPCPRDDGDVPPLPMSGVMALLGPRDGFLWLLNSQARVKGAWGCMEGTWRVHGGNMEGV